MVNPAMAKLVIYMKMFETHENEIGQKVSKRVAKLELRMAGSSIVSSGKRYFPCIM
jgi:hypothetical protein